MEAQLDQRFDKREHQWQKKMDQLKRQHADDLRQVDETVYYYMYFNPFLSGYG